MAFAGFGAPVDFDEPAGFGIDKALAGRGPTGAGVGRAEPPIAPALDEEGGDQDEAGETEAQQGAETAAGERRPGRSADQADPDNDAAPPAA